MAGEVAFKAHSSSTQAPAKPGVESRTSGKGEVTSNSKVEVPYTDYEAQNSYPLTVEYFELGDRWKDPLGGFPKEVGIIEGYFRDRVESGDIANNTNSIKDELKKILKLTNMAKEERSLVKVETVAAYIKFLSEREDIKRNIRRYGSAK